MCNLTNHRGWLSYLPSTFAFRNLQSAFTAFTCTVNFSQIRRDCFSNNVNRLVSAVQTRCKCLLWGRNFISVHYSDEVHTSQVEQLVHLTLWKMCCIFLPSSLIFLVHFDTTSFSTEGVAGLAISGHVAVRGIFHNLFTWTDLSICCGVHRYFHMCWSVNVCIVYYLNNIYNTVSNFRTSIVESFSF